MGLLLLPPPILSLLVFCGHLLREGMLLLLPLLFMMLPLLFLTKGWVARLWQVVLMLAALEWVRTAVFLASERQDAGEPWVRMAVILGATAAFTFASALLFETRTLTEIYPRRGLY